MGDTIGLRVMVRDDTITTLPGPVHSDLSEAQWLYRSRLMWLMTEGSVRKADFLARASRIANNKARELGWIVEGKATPSIFLG
jgi:hypothetical protein